MIFFQLFYFFAYLLKNIGDSLWQYCAYDLKRVTRFYIQLASYSSISTHDYTVSP
jgi:hypothetical protein